jgi:hypothetical protein
MQTLIRTIAFALAMCTAVQPMTATARQRADGRATIAARLLSHIGNFDIRHPFSGRGLAAGSRSGPVDGATGIVRHDAARPALCWDCAYESERRRPVMAGDMTFRFRPVGGTINYHF